MMFFFFTRGRIHNFFLTARPWAERGACSTRVVCDQTQTSAPLNFDDDDNDDDGDDDDDDVCSPKAVKNVTVLKLL